MTKPNYQQSFYTLPIFLVPTMLGLLIIFGIFLFVQKAFSSTSTISYATGNLCHLKSLTDIAEKYGVNYQIDQNFDMPGVQLSGNKTLIQKLYQDYNKLYPTDVIPVTSSSREPPKQCHLSNIKYHAQNVNPRLTPFIPDNVDYVSYAPTADKAVYCSYHFATGFNRPFGSKCFFMQITKDVSGKEQLLMDDISDMEQANLNAFSKRIYHQPNIFSIVEAWEDTPKSTQIYGFEFMTRWDGNRWGIGQYY